MIRLNQNSMRKSGRVQSSLLYIALVFPAKVRGFPADPKLTTN